MTVHVLQVSLRGRLPDAFIPPPPHAFTACGDVNDVVHHIPISYCIDIHIYINIYTRTYMRLMVICICMVPRRLVCGGFPVPLLVVVCRALPLAWSPPPRSFYNISMDSNRYIYIRRNTL